MSDHDELQAAARDILDDDFDWGVASLLRAAEPLARAYLAHPPLTRERVAAAVASLFSPNLKDGRTMELLGPTRLIIGGYDPNSMTDRLCRLLGVEDK